MSRKSLHDAAVDAIAKWIVTERYPAGSTLPVEAKLGEALGVSRTVVREAVKTLAAKGLVEVGPKLGSRVLDEHAWHLFDPQVLKWRLAFRRDRFVAEDLVELRMLLEPAAAGLAARRATLSERREIQRAYDAMAAAGGEIGAFSAADIRLHSMILLACHNAFLTRLVPLVERLISTTLDIYADAGWNTSHIQQASLPLHGTMARAIAAGDALAAETAARAIIARAYEDMAATRETAADTTAAPAALPRPRRAQSRAKRR